VELVSRLRQLAPVQKYMFPVLSSRRTSPTVLSRLGNAVAKLEGDFQQATKTQG